MKNYLFLISAMLLVWGLSSCKKDSSVDCLNNTSDFTTDITGVYQGQLTNASGLVSTTYRIQVNRLCNDYIEISPETGSEASTFLVYIQEGSGLTPTIENILGGPTVQFTLATNPKSLFYQRGDEQFNGTKQ